MSSIYTRIGRFPRLDLVVELLHSTSVAFISIFIVKAKSVAEMVQPTIIPFSNLRHPDFIFLDAVLIWNHCNNPQWTRLILVGIWWRLKPSSTKLYGIDPYTFLRSNHKTAISPLSFLPPFKSCNQTTVCSINPGMPGIPSFFTAVSMY